MMRTYGVFQLDIEPETDTQLMKVKAMFLGGHPGEHGLIHMTPECMSLDVLEGRLNALRGELDLIGADARRAFMQ